MLEVDLFCPLYNSAKYLDGIINGIKYQKNIIVKNIVFSVTESSDNTLQMVKNLATSSNDFKIKYFEVLKKDFSHSLTREKGMYDYCESNRVIFISDDVIMNDENLFYNLTRNLNEEIIHCFARQITKSKGIEKYTREKNYPKDSYIVSKEDIDRLQIKAFYSSDACSSYYRPKFIEINGYDHKDMKVSEDMYYCRNALLHDYKIMYCADAIVLHSHNLKVKQVYKRYYDIGLFFKQNPEFKEYKATDSGLKLAFYILGQALKHFDIPVLIKWLPDMTARYLGKKKGEK